ncbi:inactive serine/threonine-protein kinase PLK5 isoform X8 [Marmota marmota marmota]|uniref:inactive serine/threonine-protein kinase PLK5 isoform X8 n=1 Tax=Marmota marmota marmota TaxID=9994 RepID=UPI002093EE54|nr:inactive serine/threonine-protein kinase PLK5 isoform X8 [Marmota marmota marmota]
MEPRTEAAAPEPPAGGSLLARPQLRARLPAREANPSLTQGAFSRCYKLTDMSTSAVFALKVVPRAGRLPSRGKVEREIALHSRLRHHNIVAFHGHFADRDHVYMVLEYCSRQSLAHVLKARQTLTEPEVRYYLRGVIGGLRYLHQQRIVHRDLKLSNLFLNKKMEVKIGDLGLATRLGPGGRCHRVLCGTPNLLAPEVVSRKGHSCPSDIWALGCIMYTVLTGTPPFAAASLSEMYQNICDGHYPEPAHLSPNARRLIARLLAPDPAERPNLDHLLQDDFFTQGFTLDRMPPHSRHSPPAFTFPQPVGSLFRKVGQLLSTQCGPPCPCTSKEASGPGEEGPEPDSLDWGSEALVHLFTQGTLRSDPAAPQDPPGEQQPPLWAPKWVDHSSKYGFGYQLSDGGSGVLFRDGTHMALRPPGSHICYLPARGRLETFALRDVPRALGAKLAVLRLLTGYMQRRLREVSWGAGRGAPALTPCLPEGASPAPQLPAALGLCLLRFLGTSQALLLLFSNGTLQVSFSGLQTQLVLSGEGQGLLLTYWVRGQPGASYSLGTLQRRECAPAALQHLRHTLHLLQSL